MSAAGWMPVFITIGSDPGKYTGNRKPCTII
jgi:hypothetical protein